MHFLFRVLMLLFLVFSPCVFGCSSQVSPEDAERLEAEAGDEDTGEEEELDQTDDI